MVKKIIDRTNQMGYYKGMKKLTKQERSRYASYLGSIKSERKAKASRENGKKGGRPKKKVVQEVP